MDIQKLLYFCISKLVDKPEAINISPKEASEGKTLYEIRVAPQDLARVIGKEGRTFKAVRALATLTDPVHVQDIVVDTVAS